MMGDRPAMHENLFFYQFRLDDHVPADRMLRAIDRFVDLDWLRLHQGTTGRRSIDPELIVRICFGDAAGDGHPLGPERRWARGGQAACGAARWRHGARTHAHRGAERNRPAEICAPPRS